MVKCPCCRDYEGPDTDFRKGRVAESVPSENAAWRDLSVRICPNCGVVFVPKESEEKKTYEEEKEVVESMPLGDVG